MMSRAGLEQTKLRKTTKPAAKRTAKKLPVDAFKNTQLSLFQSLLCNTSDRRSELSNTIDLWDSIPRYSVSRLAMTKLRNPQGTLKLLKLDFQYRGKSLRVVIQPARMEIELKKKKGEEKGETVEMDFYPSASEELIEDALRKIATDQQQGYFDKSAYRSGVVFTLHMLREELKRRGHTRSFQEIILSMRILAKSSIEILDDEGTGGSFAVSPYMPALAGVTRKDLEADPGAKWIVQFHPLVTQSIDQLAYRQFNYDQMMSYKSQLARWLHRQLALKFTFAAHGRTFEMKYSTIKRDSAMLNGYAQKLSRLAFVALDEAFTELKAQKVLMKFEKSEERGERNKLEDATYTLTPSREFIYEMKAANARAANARLKLAGKQADVALPSTVDKSDLFGVSR